MKTPAPRAVGELISSALPQIADRLVELRIVESWGSIVGRDAARRTRPGTLTGGTLQVIVDNSPWLHELTLRVGALTADVRARFPEVRAIRLVLGSVERDPASAAAKPRRPSPLTAADREDIQAATEAIADSDVADAARRLLETARRFPRTPGSRGAV
jgi:hypothetical protein